MIDLLNVRLAIDSLVLAKKMCTADTDLFGRAQGLVTDDTLSRRLYCLDGILCATHDLRRFLARRSISLHVGSVGVGRCF